MRTISNQYGTQTMYEMGDLKKNIILSVGMSCMSVLTDLMSYIENALENHERYSDYIFLGNETIVKHYHDNGMDKDGYGVACIIMGCSKDENALDLCIKEANRLHVLMPEAEIYISGCLAYRFDIELPDYVRRLGTMSKEYIPLNKGTYDYTILKTEHIENSRMMSEYYPLKIGQGGPLDGDDCSAGVRGKYYETDSFLQIQEFIKAAECSSYEGVALISDYPSIQQVKDWCLIAERYNKPIVFINMAPEIIEECNVKLNQLIQKGLLVDAYIK